VTNISRHGFWLWLGGRELFVPFSEFPWFADASVAKITKVEWPSQDHLYWPDLDVDLSVRRTINVAAPFHLPPPASVHCSLDARSASESQRSARAARCITLSQAEVGAPPQNLGSALLLPCRRSERR